MLNGLIRLVDCGCGLKVGLGCFLVLFGVDGGFMGWFGFGETLISNVRNI
jgi:hypothetical protein